MLGDAINMDVAYSENFKFAREVNKEVQYGYFAELDESRNEEELKENVLNIIKHLGFSDYSVVNLHCIYEPQHQLSSMPTPLVRSYYENRLYTEDMILQTAINLAGPFLSSTIHDHVETAPYSSDMTRKMAAIYELNKSFGYYDCYHIPCKTHNRYLLLSVVARGVMPNDYLKLIAETKLSLSLLMDAIVFVLRNRFSKLLPVREEDLTINPKPLRVLNTLANNDLTIEQVAHKLCISVVTANQHLKTVRTKLGVKSNYASIRRCILTGIIKFDETPK
jgi:DNA-binding CsgD family transcriptional regulator